MAKTNMNPNALKYQGRPASLDVRGQQLELFPFDAFTYDRNERIIGLKSPWQFNLVNTDGTPYTGADLITYVTTKFAELEALIATLPTFDDVLAIEETGTVGTATFVKYSNGLMVCSETVSIPLIAPASIPNYSDYVEVLYPVPFLGTPLLAGKDEADDPVFGVEFNTYPFDFSGLGKTKFRYRYYFDVGESATYLGYTAIGFWK